MANKVNIAIIAGQLVVGGAERQLYLWLSNLDRERYNPVVITLHPDYGDYWEKPIEDLNITIFRISQAKIKIKRLIEIIKILQPIKPSLVHGWHLFASPYAGLAGWFFKAKSLGSLRDSYRVFTKNKISALLTLICVDAVIVNSSSASSSLKHKIFRKEQAIFTIPNAIQSQLEVTVEQNTGLAKVINAENGKLIIASLGRLDLKKRFDLLLQTIEKLIQTTQNFHFVLIGDGPENDRLKNLAVELKICDFITFTNEIPEAAALLKEFDIFAFTSLDEGMPNVIMEAAMAGLPIVTWRLPFYEELLEHGKSALLVEPENTTAMKDAILELINSPELRVSLGQAARRRMLESFSLQAFVDKMTSAYDTVLAGKLKGRN